MAFDYKKEYKEFYLPKDKPEIITIPEMKYVAVRGKGNPNEEGGAYQQAAGVLYGISYALKMSYKGAHKIDGYFEYVVPPLEGFWWQDNCAGADYNKKEEFNWISVIRLPDFIQKSDFDWAVAETERKKKIDCSKAEFMIFTEGECVQIMHHGAFDDEPETVKIMEAYVKEQGYEEDFENGRLHHEIYLSDPRKTDVLKRKTVIRHPVKKA